MGISTKGLEKVSGYSFEEVHRALTENRIPHEVARRPHRSDSYFRNSAIVVTEEDSRKRRGYFQAIMDMFPDAKASDNYLYCHASYRPTPEFDFSALNGRPTFKKGLLIEATLIC
ncbi:MAG: hypothetical protein J4400_02060 [Candidatus Aenigmarchaeota archaeon]|nr:hypothetical protein [Candidatus Aenigmarchaeota archaeon]